MSYEQNCTCKNITFASEVKPCFSARSPLLQSACQQIGYCHSNDNPSNLCLFNFSTAFSTKLRLAVELVTNLEYLSVPESVQPPIDNSTLIVGLAAFATDTTRSKKPKTNQLVIMAHFLSKHTMKSFFLSPKAMLLKTAMLTIRFIRKDMRGNQLQRYWVKLSICIIYVSAKFGGCFYVFWNVFSIIFSVGGPIGEIANNIFRLEIMNSKIYIEIFINEYYLMHKKLTDFPYILHTANVQYLSICRISMTLFSSKMI